MFASHNLNRRRLSMKKILSITLALSFISFISIQGFSALTGRQIVDQSEKLPKATSAKTQMMMIITKGKVVMEKEFLAFQKTVDGDDKVLISFVKPTKIRVLTHTHKDRDDDQWIKLSSGKVKRIVGEEKGGSFVQSHLTYEDLESRDVNSFQWTNLGTVKAMGVECYKVEAIPIKGKKTYEKANIYFRTSDCFVVKAEFYKNGSIYKYIENENIQKVNGILTPMKVTVKMSDKSGQTELTVKKVAYNVEIENAKFAKEAL
jgi:hypothetical protein